MKKIISVISVLALSVSLLAGCASGKTDITLTSNDSGSFKEVVKMDASLLAEDTDDLNAYVRELKKNLADLGYKVGTETANKTTFITITRGCKFSHYSELQQALTDAGYSGVYVLKDGEGLRYRDSLSSAMTEQLGLAGIKSNDLSDYGITEKEANDLINTMSTTTVVKLDKDIIKVSKGGTISADKKTATFTFNGNDTLNQEIMVSTKAETNAPKVENITSKTTATTYTRPVTFTANDMSGIKSIGYTLNGGTKVTYIKNGKLIRKNGAYKFTVKDYYGNTTNVAFTIKDTVAPTVDDVKDGGIYDYDRWISVEDRFGVASVTLQRNGGKVIKQKDPTFIDVDRSGRYKLVAKDINGNTKTVRFRVDMQKPVVTGVKNGYKYKKAVTVKYSDNQHVKSATINGKAFKSGKKVSKKGTYKVVVKDDAGNTRTVKFTIK